MAELTGRVRFQAGANGGWTGRALRCVLSRRQAGSELESARLERGWLFELVLLLSILVSLAGCTGTLVSRTCIASPRYSLL